MPRHPGTSRKTRTEKAKHHNAVENEPATPLYDDGGSDIEQWEENTVEIPSTRVVFGTSQVRQNSRLSPAPSSSQRKPDKSQGEPDRHQLCFEELKTLRYQVMIGIHTISLQLADCESRSQTWKGLMIHRIC